MAASVLRAFAGRSVVDPSVGYSGSVGGVNGRSAVGLQGYMSVPCRRGAAANDNPELRTIDPVRDCLWRCKQAARAERVKDRVVEVRGALQIGYLIADVIDQDGRPTSRCTTSPRYSLAEL